MNGIPVSRVYAASFVFAMVMGMVIDLSGLKMEDNHPIGDENNRFLSGTVTNDLAITVGMGHFVAEPWIRNNVDDCQTIVQLGRSTSDDPKASKNGTAANPLASKLIEQLVHLRDRSMNFDAWVKSSFKPILTASIALTFSLFNLITAVV
ncbi:hypothetical protein BJ170DRAFT_683847 [Xylariales sp. AK1849]|nr:hypothetical protein BJ170DRAFT_683847 [Xylariales sp. AK1849]